MMITPYPKNPFFFLLSNSEDDEARVGEIDLFIENYYRARVGFLMEGKILRNFSFDSSFSGHRGCVTPSFIYILYNACW